MKKLAPYIILLSTVLNPNLLNNLRYYKFIDENVKKDYPINYGTKIVNETNAPSASIGPRRLPLTFCVISFLRIMIDKGYHY